MTANWAAVVVGAIIGLAGFLRWSNRLAALLERLTVMVERHDDELAELRDDRRARPHSHRARRPMP